MDSIDVRNGVVVRYKTCKTLGRVVGFDRGGKVVIEWDNQLTREDLDDLALIQDEYGYQPGRHI